MKAKSKKLLLCGGVGFLLCVIAIIGILGSRPTRRTETARAEGSPRLVVDEPRDIPTVMDGEGDRDKPSAAREVSAVESEIAQLPVDLTPRAEKALLLLEYPPPRDGVQVAESNGPMVVTPEYKFQEGDHYRVHYYQIITGQGVEKDLPDWTDLGMFAVDVKEVNHEANAAVLSVRQLTPMDWVVGSTASQKLNTSFTLPVSQVTTYADGRIDQPAGPAKFQGAVGLQIAVKRAENLNSGHLRFTPGKQVSVGQSWEFRSEDANAPDRVTVFTFEGYSRVGGVQCMRIKEKSKGLTDLQVEFGEFDMDVRVKTEIEGYHYFDVERGLRWRTDLITQTNIESDSQLFAGVPMERTIRSVKQVVK